MDLLRSCYRGLMRFREGDPAKEVRWFKCAPDARVYEKPTVFRSANYEATPFENDGLGEQRPGSRPWSNGSRAAGFTGMGTGCSAPDDWYINGIPNNVSYTISKDANGVPLCCFDTGGALVLGGDASVTPRGGARKQGGLALFGDCSVDFKHNDGAIAFNGDAEVHFHPAAGQLCCPGLAGPLLGITSAGPLCFVLNSLIVNFLQVGQEWHSSQLVAPGVTLTCRVYCVGNTVNDWRLDATLTGNGAIIAFPVTLGSSCAPLFLAFGPMAFPLAGPPCNDLWTLSIF